MDNSLVIVNLINGDHQTYTAIINKYHHPLCIYAKNLAQDGDIAQDIVQEVFIRLWEKRSSLSKQTLLKSYLYKAVYNEFIDTYRKGKKLTALEQIHHEQLYTLATDYDEADLQPMFTKIMQLIEELDPIYKETFTLSRLEGLTHAEIANYQNIAVKTVEARLAKAFAQLRAQISQKELSLFLFLYTQCNTKSSHIINL